MPTDFQLAIRGDLQKTIDSRAKAVLNGLAAGTKEGSTLTKTALRQDALRAGFSRKIATTFQDRVYPERGALSYSPRAIVYSKIPHIMASFVDGLTVRPSKAKGLTIPIAGGPAEKLRVRRGGNIIDTFKARFGNDSLFAIQKKDGTTILAARLRATSSGRFTKLRTRKATKTQGERTLLSGLVTVPVFTIAKQAKHERRLTSRQIMEKARRRHPNRLSFHITTKLRESERATGVSI